MLKVCTPSGARAWPHVDGCALSRTAREGSPPDPVRAPHTTGVWVDPVRAPGGLLQMVWGKLLSTGSPESTKCTSSTYMQ